MTPILSTLSKFDRDFNLYKYQIERTDATTEQVLIYNREKDGGADRHSELDSTGNTKDVYWNDSEMRKLNDTLTKSVNIGGLFIKNSNKLTVAYINV